MPSKRKAIREFKALKQKLDYDGLDKNAWLKDVLALVNSYTPQGTPEYSNWHNFSFYTQAISRSELFNTPGRSSTLRPEANSEAKHNIDLCIRYIRRHGIKKDAAKPKSKSWPHLDWYQVALIILAAIAILVGFRRPRHFFTTFFDLILSEIR